MTPSSVTMSLPVEGLSVVGEAARELAPEIVELSFELHSMGLSAAAALQENAMKAKHIGQTLTATGIAQIEAKNGGMELLPILHLPNPISTMLPGPLLLPSAFGAPISGPAGTPATVSENPSLIGYRAVSSFKVAVQDIHRVGEVVDIVTRVGAIPGGSIRFLVHDEATIERTLLEEAVRRARDKANTLATAVGKSRGDPVAISEEFTTYQPQQPYGNGRHNPFLMAPAGSNVRLPFHHGQLTFCARVSVVYQLQ